MAKSAFKFDEIILEKRNDDPAAPASGKFTLYNRNGAAYIRDGDTGGVQLLGESQPPVVYLGSGAITSGTSQWNIALPPGYIELEFALKLQTNSTASRNLSITFDGVTAANAYRQQYLRNNTGTPHSSASQALTAISVPTIVPRNNVEPQHDWTRLSIFDYESSTSATKAYAIGWNSNHGYMALVSAGQANNYISATSMINLSTNADAFGNCEYYLWGKRVV